MNIPTPSEVEDMNKQHELSLAQTRDKIREDAILAEVKDILRMLFSVPMKCPISYSHCRGESAERAVLYARQRGWKAVTVFAPSYPSMPEGPDSCAYKVTILGPAKEE